MVPGGIASSHQRGAATRIPAEPLSGDHLVTFERLVFDESEVVLFCGVVGPVLHTPAPSGSVRERSERAGGQGLHQ